MSDESLRGHVGTAESVVNIARAYATRARRHVEQHGSEDASESRFYDTRIAFVPHYYRGFRSAFTELIDRGYTPEDLAPHLENQFRSSRNFVWFIAPGAYLDRRNPEHARLAFLDQVAQGMQAIPKHRKSRDFDYAMLDALQPIIDRKRTAFGHFKATAIELCDLIYFGQQSAGYASFGLDTKSLPDTAILQHDFDMNLGVQSFPDIKKIETVALYDTGRYPGLTVSFKPQFVDVFFHRYGNDPTWIYGPPHSSHLVGAGVFMDGKSLSIFEIERLTERFLSIIADLTSKRQAMAPLDAAKERFRSQSIAIRNLSNLLGEQWRPSGALTRSLRENAFADSLKSRWSIRHSFELSLALMSRSLEWIKNAVLA